MLEGLRSSGCVILCCSPPTEAPFRISFCTPWGERIGIVAYAFTANSRVTANRPADEHRFQVKYGTKDGSLHELWQDPFGLYVTLFLGINSDQGFFVAADPVLNSPTRFFISKEFKQQHVDCVLSQGWHTWEREQRRASSPEPREVLVGGTANHFLRYILFEREARGEDQGHRQLLGERYGRVSLRTSDDFIRLAERASLGVEVASYSLRTVPELLSPSHLHSLEVEFAMNAKEVLNLIATAPRLKMAVRGWVAERHLEAKLRSLSEVVSVESLEEDGKPDFQVEMRNGRRPVLIECKNVLRTRDTLGRARMDFMRTRASKADPCSRYYKSAEFDVLVACLHAATEQWEFAFKLTKAIPNHSNCAGRLHHRLVVDDAWERNAVSVLMSAAS